MSDSINEQISQFIDDEMSAEQSEFFLRRLQRDGEARSQYMRYQLIGAAVRGEYSNANASDLGRRLEQALDDETAPRRAATKWSGLFSGAGIAASVALVAIFGLRALNLAPQDPLAGTAVDGASSELSLPSYVVPTNTTDTQQFVRVPGEVTGIQFLMHHAGYTSGVSRTIMQSSMIAAQEVDPTIRPVAENEPVEEMPVDASPLDESPVEDANE
jgi:sigma-E factor negative regulatory protein RseA